MTATSAQGVGQFEDGAQLILFIPKSVILGCMLHVDQ